MDRRHHPLFPRPVKPALAGALAVLLLASCGSDGNETADADPSTTSAPATPAETTETTEVPLTIEPGDPSTFFPTVVAAEATQADDDTWTFSVTLSSPYDTPEQYADAWRVVDPDGNELGLRFLTHDHANEQPFTRSQSGIEIPEGVTTVTIEGRDQVNGWGGQFLEFDLPS